MNPVCRPGEVSSSRTAAARYAPPSTIRGRSRSAWAARARSTAAPATPPPDPVAKLSGPGPFRAPSRRPSATLRTQAMRLVTRGDLDGLTCAVLLSLNEEIDSISLIHPQDISDGRADIRPGDIIANLPYHPGCAMWFDHHLHTATANIPEEAFRGVFAQAPSAARLVYEYYGGEAAMPQFAELVRETDRLDSANLTPTDVLDPQSYIKLGFTIDGRTGIGHFEDYFHDLVDLLRNETPIEDVLDDPSVKARCLLIESENQHFCEALREHSHVDGNVVITDFRGLNHTPIGNRFLIYALYP